MKKKIQQERSQDLYEILDAYPQAPYPRIADIHDPESYLDIGFRPGTYRYHLLKLAFRATGFLSFYQTLPESLSVIRRKKNMRIQGLFAPALSATIALLDDPKKQTPLRRAASLVWAAFELYDDMMTGKLAPDRYGDHIFEMGLYPNLFSTSLKVGKGRVRLQKFNANFKINVLVRRQFYVLELLHNEKLLSYEEIYYALQMVVDNSAIAARKNNDLSIGLITASNNATQFKAFKALLKDKTSKASVEALNRSFITLCFDIDSEPATYSEAAYLAHNTNHGNRWYHSATQLVVFGNGKSSVIFNFTAYIDGITMSRAGYELYHRAHRLPVLNTQQRNRRYSYQQLHWKFPEKYLRPIQKDICLVSDNQQAIFQIDNLGGDFFNKHEMAAIPSFVLALQMTVKEYTGDYKKIQQFVSMAKYCCISLLTTIVTTKEVVEFCERIDVAHVENSEKLNLLVKANESQIEAIRKARKELPLDVLFFYHLHSKNGLNKLFTNLIIRILSLLQGVVDDTFCSAMS